jgi:hypothetical protein
MPRYDEAFVDRFADAGRVPDLLHTHLRQWGGRR